MNNEYYITGYQYSADDKRFMGVYQFPANKDKHDIHMPPNTTLSAPPEKIPAGSAAFWNEKKEKWEIRKNKSIVSSLPDSIDYANLLPEFIDNMKNMGLWTEAMQAKYDAAQVENKDEPSA